MKTKKHINLHESKNYLRMLVLFLVTLILLLKLYVYILVTILNFCSFILVAHYSLLLSLLKSYMCINHNRFNFLKILCRIFSLTTI